MTYEPWEVVVVPFPFTETEDRKRRPALVLSQRSFNEGGYTVLAMITTKSEPAWPGDSVIGDLGSAGLERPCIIRWLEPARATTSRAGSASWSTKRWRRLGSSGEAVTR